MHTLSLRPAALDDLQTVTDIYNSNPHFLLHHLGQPQVDRGFIEREWQQMRAMGFGCCLAEEPATGQAVGFLDYCEYETVYLSLLMLDARAQGKGLGARCFRHFEQKMARNGRKSIRIDVVNDYPDNALPFWEKQGFTPTDTVTLTWGQKTSRAVVMLKALASLQY